MTELDIRNPQGSDDIIEIDLQELLLKLQKNWALILSVVLLAMAAALQYSFNAQPIYQAKTRLMVDRRPPKILKVDETVITDNTDQTNFFNSQVEVLKSLTLAKLVLEELGNYEPAGRRLVSSVKLEPITDSQRLDALSKSVKISPVRMTSVIEVSVEDPDPELAARIANIWTRAYVFVSSVDQLVQRRSELESDLYQRSKYLKSKNPVIVGLQSEIDSVTNKIYRERLKLGKANLTGDMLSWSGDAKNVKILDLAQVPQKPVRPRKALNLALALVLGLFTGGMLAFFKESMDQTIQTAQDLEQAVNMSCLVAIPFFKGRKEKEGLIPELVSEKNRTSLVAESFRHLRTSLIFSNPDLTKKSIMITSASADEGKTTTAINLATVFAQSGERTLLVDADLRSPCLQDIFKLNAYQGLSELLAGQPTDYRAAVRPSGIENLDLMVSGAIPKNPSELLVSKNMDELIGQLTRAYDRVIFDLPPVLAATDASVMSAKVEATVLVVRSGFAHRLAVQGTVKSLKAVQAKIMCVVLNRVDFYGQGHHYGFSLYEPYTRKKIGAQRKKGLFSFASS